MFDYNPEESVSESTPDFTFDSARLIEWAETKDPTKTYAYISPYGCFLAAFFRENGYPNVSVGPAYVRPWNDGRSFYFPEGWEYVARGNPADDVSERMTYGAALARARGTFIK
jgi:hypothetical protein